MILRLLTNLERNLILSKLEEAGFQPHLVTRNPVNFLDGNGNQVQAVCWTYEIFGWSLITIAAEKGDF